MVTRYVYIPRSTPPFYRQKEVSFEWNAGQAVSQKQKNVQAIHESFLKDNADLKVLEVSTKSDQALGVEASPFNLKLDLPFLKKSFPVENIYQASKVFAQGGPYYDILGLSPLEAKRDPRLEDSGELVHFSLDNRQYPIVPDMVFYAWIYIRAILQNGPLKRGLLDYDAFSDVEFNPARGSVCQAMACAIYVALAREKLLGRVQDFDQFYALFSKKEYALIKAQSRPASMPVTMKTVAPALVKKRAFAVGQWIRHPVSGAGQIMKKDARTYLINFTLTGPKTMSKDYVETHCTPIAR